MSSSIDDAESSAASSTSSSTATGTPTGASTGSAQVPAAEPAPREPRAALVFDDPLDRQSSDDTDRGWGERPRGEDAAADLRRFLDEKPPHHL
jgi:hypothetical protein